MFPSFSPFNQTSSSSSSTPTPFGTPSFSPFNQTSSSSTPTPFGTPSFSPFNLSGTSPAFSSTRTPFGSSSTTGTPSPSYAPTTVDEQLISGGNQATRSKSGTVKLISISAMPAYDTRSHEELRLDNYMTRKTIAPFNPFTINSSAVKSSSSIFPPCSSSPATNISTTSWPSTIPTWNYPAPIAFTSSNTSLTTTPSSSTNPFAINPSVKSTSSGFPPGSSLPVTTSWPSPGTAFPSLTSQPLHVSPSTNTTDPSNSFNPFAPKTSLTSPASTFPFTPLSHNPFQITSTSAAASTFGILPPRPQLSFSRSTPIQYGISSIPVKDKPAPVRYPLLTTRHFSRGRKLPIRKYDPKLSGPKIPFYSVTSEMPDTFFVPRENPRVEPGYCRRVKHFVVGRHGYVSIKFFGETDVRKLDLETLIQFNNREVVVFMDESKKPPVGEGLNIPAEITLLNIKCIDKKTGMQCFGFLSIIVSRIWIRMCQSTGLIEIGVADVGMPAKVGCVKSQVAKVTRHISLSSRAISSHSVNDIKEKDKIEAKTRQNQEQMGSVEESRVKSLGDKIIYDLNKTPDLFQEPPQNCLKCGNPVDDSFEPSNDNTNVVNALQEPFVVKQDPGKNSSQSPPQINHHCCYECGDSLEDIFCHQCTCELCGKGTHYDYNCPSKVPIIPDPEPFNNQTVDELPQTLPSFDPTCYSEDGNSFTYDSKSNLVHDSPNVFNPPPQPSLYSCEFCENDAQEQYWNIPVCYDDVTPILSTEEPDNSLSMGDEYLDTIPATESDEFIKSSVENLVPIPKYVEAPPLDSELVSLEVMEIVIPEVGGIDDDILLTIKDDILQEISSGNTTTRSDISIPEYEGFYDDHVKKISSGSITTHSDSSLYDSFIFDLSINPFPLADRSDFYEFANELAHIISPPEYDCFSFKNKPNSRDFTMDEVEDIFPTREPRVHNALPTYPNLQQYGFHTL
uniref:Nuclear pore complex protein NUP98A isoform X1 n=1 Tax=Tanacetum cinerariifolium TaxID=118510 RepID=A0A6L2NNH2_TANCI|nr:nuclear pore complex protein NUP98A isoform X1 [Tanacetum cinerariifolium]